MDERPRARRATELLFTGSALIFAAANLACALVFAAKRPRADVLLYVLSALHFAHVGLSTIPFDRLRAIVHAGGFHGWRNLHAGFCATWVYVASIDAARSGGGGVLSVPSCAVMGFAPSLVCYVANGVHLGRLLRDEAVAAEVLAHTKDVLLLYHKSFQATQNGAASAEKALAMMERVIRGDDGGGLGRASEPLRGVRYGAVLALTLVTAACAATYFKARPREGFLAVAMTAASGLHTVRCSFYRITDATGPPPVPAASARPSVVSLASMAASAACTWAIYYVTLSPLAVAASGFHFADALSSVFARAGVANDVLHAAVVLVLCVMISL